MSKWNAGARDGGANQKKTVMPPPSDAYRDAYDDIFKKQPTETLPIETRKPAPDLSPTDGTAQE